MFTGGVESDLRVFVRSEGLPRRLMTVVGVGFGAIQRPLRSYCLFEGVAGQTCPSVRCSYLFFRKRQIGLRRLIRSQVEKKSDNHGLYPRTR